MYVELSRNEVPLSFAFSWLFSGSRIFIHGIIILIYLTLCVYTHKDSLESTHISARNSNFPKKFVCIWHEHKQHIGMKGFVCRIQKYALYIPHKLDAVGNMIRLQL